jgi:drug/metabolite transporter (DMT)-like permease
LWGLAHSLTMTIAKTLSADIQTTALVMIRNLFGSSIIVTTVLLNKHKIKLSTNLSLHFLRIILGTTATICTYYSYRNLNLSTATSIGFTTPLISSILALIFLKEKLTSNKILALVLGYLGIILVAQPKFSHNSFALIIAFIANITASLSLVCAKKLTQKEQALQILFKYQIGALLVTTVLFLSRSSEITVSQNNLLKLFAVSLIAILSQFCYLKSLKYADLSFVAPFEYVRILYANILGYYVFSEQLDVYDLLGCCLIIIASLSLSKQKNKT